jgi:hypothetical protein
MLGNVLLVSTAGIRISVNGTSIVTNKDVQMGRHMSVVVWR